MYKAFTIGAQIIAVMLVFIAGATLIADAESVAGIAKPLVDLYTVDRWSVSIVLLLVAIAFSVVGVLFAWKDHNDHNHHSAA